ncbi:TolC family protein [Pseudogemmobacter sp. W21_MBD1_M6]|uniref:TolC family protein n=1 Tax=Pseudogemmobacter sp. W21_MBD1_M6 TaxID=3240271 RepID=UPI003F958935
MKFSSPYVLALGLVAISGCAEPVKFERSLDEVVQLVDKEARGPNYGPIGTPRPPQAGGDLFAFAASATEKSPSVTAAEMRRAASEARIEELRRAFRPQVSMAIEQTQTQQDILYSSNPSFAGNSSKYTTLDTTLTARQKVLDYAASADIASARAELVARGADLMVAQQDALDGMLRRYIGSAEALERFSLANAEVAYYTSRNQSEAQQVGEGAMRQSKRAETMAELARARSDLAVAQADYRIRVDSFCRMASDVACPLPRAVNLSRPLPRPEPLTEAERNAVANSPEQQSLKGTLSAALREVERARLELRPRVSVVAERSRRDRGGSLFDGSSLTETTDIGVLMEWDMYTSGRVKATKTRELNEALAIEHEREQRLRDQVNDLETAHAALAALWQNDQALQAVVTNRAQGLSALRLEMDAGSATEVEIGMAQMEVVRAQVLRQATRRNYVAATVARARATGALDADVVKYVANILSDGQLSTKAYR